MGETTAISWTHHTFNPWWGCTKVSEACRNCYAERDANRFAPGLWGPEAPRKPASEATWREPLRWDRAAAKAGERRRVFCASMADVFEDRRDLDEPRARLWGLIEATPNLDWLLLTKRPEAVVRLAPGRWVEGSASFPQNVWLGTTAENQAAADERIPHLLRVPARVRFLSCEPLLGYVDLGRAFSKADEHGELSSPRTNRDGSMAVSWVIAGGESGAAARPMHPTWVRSLRDQCAEAGVPFHFKQWGEWAPRGADGFGGDVPLVDSAHRRRVSADNGGDAQLLENASDDDHWMQRVGKSAAGRLLGGVEHNAFPVPS